jgi:hypothetical protein
MIIETKRLMLIQHYYWTTVIIQVCQFSQKYHSKKFVYSYSGGCIFLVSFNLEQFLSVCMCVRVCLYILSLWCIQRGNVGYFVGCPSIVFVWCFLLIQFRYFIFGRNPSEVGSVILSLDPLRRYMRSVCLIIGGVQLVKVRSTSKPTL